jgi:predicted acetyltransferase
MKFIFPTAEYEQQAIEYIQEFHDHNSEINGSGGLDGALKTGAYTDWLAKVMRDIDIANIPAGRVPAFTYFYVREEDGRVVGMINIRLALNDFLREEGGHIGYSVRPTERRKGYATRMLREALALCGTIGLNDIIISCDKDNPASAGVIKNNGGVLESEFYSKAFQTVVRRYRIKTGA